MTRAIAVVFALLLVCGIGFTGYKLYTNHVTAAGASKAQPAPTRDDLRKYMQSRVHEEYTLLSFTVWHDRPLTPAKMDSIAAASSRVMEMSQELTSYTAIYREQGWSNDDVKFFDEKRLQLSRVAEELNHAAQKRDSQEVMSFFMHLDATCQSCHKRFRPDLQWL